MNINMKRWRSFDPRLAESSERSGRESLQKALAPPFQTTCIIVASAVARGAKRLMSV